MAKKQLIIILVIFITIIIFLAGVLISNNYTLEQIAKENKEYEKYVEKTIPGIDLATLINRVMETNKKNNISKNEKGNFIDNGKNSVRIDIKLISDKELNTYPMETIINNDVMAFVEHFSSINFECIGIEYHQETKKVSKLIFEQKEE